MSIGQGRFGCARYMVHVVVDHELNVDFLDYISFILSPGHFLSILTQVI